MRMNDRNAIFTNVVVFPTTMKVPNDDVDNDEDDRYKVENDYDEKAEGTRPIIVLKGNKTIVACCNLRVNVSLL